MARRAYVIGVGLTKFVKPSPGQGAYWELAREAALLALTDAGLSCEAIQQLLAGYVYGPSTCGQRAAYEIGLAGIPIYNVNNNCATGSTALFLAQQLVAGGLADCVLALGFEKMQPGSVAVDSCDPANPLHPHLRAMQQLRSTGDAPIAAQIFGNAGREHMERYGTRPEHFAKVAAKNHRHSANNPRAQFQTPWSLQDVLASPVIYPPLTKLQCCPTSDGAAAAIVASQDFVKQRHLDSQAVEIAAMVMVTDIRGTFDRPTCMKVAGYEMSRLAAVQAYERSGLGPEQIDVIELHDCFSTSELITYEALGLCEPGHGGELIDSGAVTYGGQWVVNPSGGLISKGHPLGATGLAQCAELVWQLRGAAGARQVPGAKVALQHNLGLGGAAVVAIYRRPDAVASRA